MHGHRAAERPIPYRGKRWKVHRAPRRNGAQRSLIVIVNSIQDYTRAREPSNAEAPTNVSGLRARRSFVIRKHARPHLAN